MSMISEMVVSPMSLDEVVQAAINGTDIPGAQHSLLVLFGFEDFLWGLLEEAGTGLTDPFIHAGQGDNPVAVSMCSEPVVAWVAVNRPQVSDDDVEDSGCVGASAQDWDAFVAACEQAGQDKHVYFTVMM